MTWAGTTVWWACYPLGFAGAGRTQDASDAAKPDEHRLLRLTGWLDYLLALGADGLLLGPVFRSRSHGYDTLDHFSIDPRLGEAGDLEELLARCRERGIRVALDGVFNHVSRDHAVVRRALAGGPDSPDGRWIRWVGPHPRGFEGNLDLVELDLAHPPVREYVVGVMTYWLDRGIDGWRLDAAYSPGADAWRPILDRVRQSHPHCWSVAEVIHGDYADFAERAGVDSVTQYELWKAIWSSLNDRNFHELAWTLRRHAEVSRRIRPLTFVGNHDVTRIASRLQHRGHLELATALLLLLPGIPALYAGDEQGFTGEKTDGPTGDYAVRPEFPPSPDQLSPLGAGTADTVRRLTALRRAHPWLVDADLGVTHLTDDTVAVVLDGAGAGKLTLAINAGEEPAEIPGPAGPLRVEGPGWVVV